MSADGHAWDCLRAVLETVEPGTDPVSANTWHKESTAAQLTPAEIGAAHKRAVTEGWLEPVGEWVHGWWSPNTVQSLHGASKGRWITRYRRTAKGQPATAIAGQGALFQ